MTVPQKFIGVPQWTKDIDPHRHGYPSYMDRAVERRQLDECVEATEETVDYLYGEFTPTTTVYPAGSRPMLEMVVESVCGAGESDVDRARKLLHWRRANYHHLGKCGLGTEEEILLGGYSMCHDASRCFITLCQVAGLGARMVIGLHDEKKVGHTLTEVHVAGKWSVFDPSPCVPYPYYPLEDGTLASAWEIRQDPSIPSRCEPEFESPLVGTVAELFANFRLANYSLEESTRNMALRFVRLVTAQKVVENYDYVGHLKHQPPSAFCDLDEVMSQWLAGTLRKGG